MAAAEPRPAGAAGAGLPAQGRNVHRARGRVRSVGGDRVAVCGGDGRAVVGPLAQARQALRKAKRDGLHYLVLDGTLIPIDRIAADRPYFSGKHRVHGMNVQVIAAPDGTILWTSGALPGKAHDLSAARIWGILRALERAGIITLADKAYQGAEGPVRTPYKGDPDG
ncbi:transposase family protein [Nonomuraea sp. C10]|nr:transposase family protein [Nonomuraea sp. C10]